MDDSDEAAGDDPPSATAPFEAPPRLPIIPDDEQLVYDEHVDIDGRPELLVVIVEAVAEIREAEVSALLPNIEDAVDVDGLKNVFRYHPGTPYRSGWVTFFFCGCRVVLNSNHRLRIYDRRAAGSNGSASAASGT